MMYFILAVIFAKPLYWLGKVSYLYYKNPGDIQTENPRILYYKGRLFDWCSQVWDVIGWSKEDL